MSERNSKIGFITKISLMIIGVIFFVLPVSYGRTGTKLFSIGNNSAWSLTSTWSLTANGPVAGIIPQSNDTVIIDCAVVQNINLSFTDKGLLIVTNSGVLRGDNLDLVFSEYSALQCDGEIRTNNLTITENSTLLIEDNGKLLVKNSFLLDSPSSHKVNGKVTVTGNFQIGSSSGITGKGAIQSASYIGNGYVFSINSASLIADGSLVSESCWIGTSDNDLNNPMNWSGGIIPSESSNVAILASSHNPELLNRFICKNLYVNSGAVLSVYPDAFVQINGNLSVIGAGRVLLKNTVAAKSSLILKGEITGNVQVEYPVVAGQKSLISSPVSMAKSGTFLSMYLRGYDEASSNWGNYIVPTDDPLEIMKGYELFSLTTETRIFDGTLNHDPKSFFISNSGNGINLTGNPFTSYIDWESNDNNAWQRDAIASAIYYPDPSGSGNYAVYLPGGDDAVSLNNGSRYIAPTQGFFVKASKPGALSISEQSCVSSLNDSRQLLKNNSIKFRLKDGDGKADEVLFRVIDNSSFSFDDASDAIKIQGNETSTSLFLEAEDDVKYAINSVPSLNSSLVIPVNIVSAKSGMFTLSTSGGFNFDYRYPVILVDKELDKYIDLRADSTYSFYHSPEMNQKRFEIQFSSPEGVGESKDLLSEVNIFPGELIINGSENVGFTAYLFTIDGKVVSTSKGILSEGIKLSTGNIPPGLYIVKLINADNTLAKKILIK